MDVIVTVAEQVSAHGRHDGKVDQLLLRVMQAAIKGTMSSLCAALLCAYVRVCVCMCMYVHVYVCIYVAIELSHWLRLQACVRLIISLARCSV